MVALQQGAASGNDEKRHHPQGCGSRWPPMAAVPWGSGLCRAKAPGVCRAPAEQHPHPPHGSSPFRAPPQQGGGQRALLPGGARPAGSWPGLASHFSRRGPPYKATAFSIYLGWAYLEVCCCLLPKSTMKTTPMAQQACPSREQWLALLSLLLTNPSLQTPLFSSQDLT